MLQVYPFFRTIKRTVVRPVRRGVVWHRVDVQALPPPGWCVGCGAEVYIGEVCERCKRVKN